MKNFPFISLTQTNVLRTCSHRVFYVLCVFSTDRTCEQRMCFASMPMVRWFFYTSLELKKLITILPGYDLEAFNLSELLISQRKTSEILLLILQLLAIQLTCLFPLCVRNLVQLNQVAFKLPTDVCSSQG